MRISITQLSRNIDVISLKLSLEIVTISTQTVTG